MTQIKMAYETKSRWSEEERKEAYRKRGKRAKDRFGNVVGYYDMNGEIVYFGR